MNGSVKPRPDVAGAIGMSEMVNVLESRLVTQRLCTQVAVELGVMLSDVLEEEFELIATVAADVVARWSALSPLVEDRPVLFGPEGYTASGVALRQ